VFELVEDVVDRFVLQRAPLGQWYGARRARLEGWRTIPVAADRAAAVVAAAAPSARSRRARRRSPSRRSLRVASRGVTGRHVVARRSHVRPMSCGPACGA
jgi:hypothetical protein